MFIKFDNKRASFANGNLSVGYSRATLPEDPVIVDPPVIEPLGFPTNDFNDIEAVYDALYPEDKLILIIRHGHRNGEELTTLGEAQCKLAGSKLTGDFSVINDSKYISSDIDRTRKTCYNIMLGRGDTHYTSYSQIPSNYRYYPEEEGLLSLPLFDKIGEKGYNVLRDYDFQALQGYKDTSGDGWGKMSNYSFGLHQDVDDGTLLARKEEKDELSNLILNKLIDISDKKVNIYSSHDYKLTPILSTFTKVKYDFQAGEIGKDISEGVTREYPNGGKWINYLSGLACVIHSNEVKEYIPVRGLSVGYTYGYVGNTSNNYTGPTGTFEWTPFLP